MVEALKTITIVSGENCEKWKNGELYINLCTGEFLSISRIITESYLKGMSLSDFYEAPVYVIDEKLQENNLYSFANYFKFAKEKTKLYIDGELYENNNPQSDI